MGRLPDKENTLRKLQVNLFSPIAKEDLDILYDCYRMMMKFYDSDPKKVDEWFYRRNHMLNGKTPLQMHQAGKIREVYQYIKIWMED